MLSGTFNEMADRVSALINDLKDSERQYRTLVQQSSDGIFGIDPATKIILTVNDRLAQMLGYTVEELVGQHLSLFCMVSPEHIEAIIARLRQSGSLFLGYAHFIRKNGSYADAERSASLFSHDGIEMILINVRDITERKRIEDQVTKDLHLASKVQHGFLPTDIDSERLTLKTFYQPSQQVSGDLYGYVWLDGGNRLFGYLLDIMGHGVSVALRTAALSVIFRQSAEQAASIVTGKQIGRAHV